jgi:uncharacterized protein
LGNAHASFLRSVTTNDLFRADGEDAVVLSIHAEPGAGRSEVVGRHGGAVKVRVAAPPEQGRANDAIAALLADRFGLPAASVTLSSGETSRSKRFRLAGVEPDGFDVVLERVLEDPRPGSKGHR